MQVKLFEVRDDGTCISALAIQLDSENEAERWLLARAGYGLAAEDHRRYVLLMNLAGGAGEYHCDPYDWTRARTMRLAHHHIIDHFDELANGAVVDVEYLLGERETPKETDRLWRPPASVGGSVGET